MSFSWHPQKFIKGVTDKVGKNLDRAAITLVAEVKESFGSPQKMPKGQRTKVTGKRMKAKTFRAYQHSRAGQPPFVQTGNLRRSISYDKPESMLRRVGSTMQSKSGGYALHLELGTRNMKARPYLRPALKKLQAKLAKIVAGKE